MLVILFVCMYFYMPIEVITGLDNTLSLSDKFYSPETGDFFTSINLSKDF